jgi:hypothetical protein
MRLNQHRSFSRIVWSKSIEKSPTAITAIYQHIFGNFCAFGCLCFLSYRDAFWLCVARNPIFMFCKDEITAQRGFCHFIAHCEVSSAVYCSGEHIPDAIHNFIHICWNSSILTTYRLHIKDRGWSPWQFCPFAIWFQSLSVFGDSHIAWMCG